MITLPRKPEPAAWRQVIGEHWHYTHGPADPREVHDAGKPCEALFTEAQLEAAVEAALEEAAKLCETYGGPAKWGSENSDRYHIQDEWGRTLARVVRSLAGQGEKK